jgi:tetratricopeptide (TPR) repeat protein
MDSGKSICVEFGRTLGHRMNSPEYLYASGLIHALLGSFKEAESSYQQAITARPAYWQAHYSLGVLYAGNGSYSHAITELKIALDAKPDSIRICRELTRLLRKNEQYDLAIAIYRNVLEAVRENPHQHILLHGLGCTCYSAGRYADASAVFRKALEQKPWDPNLHVKLGTSLLAEGKLQEAAGEFEAALRIKPDVNSVLGKLEAVSQQGGRRASLEDSSRE